MASCFSYVLRSNVSIAAPAIIEDLTLSEVEWGWILAAFTAGYAIFQIPGGIFGDRFGPRKALTIAAVLWSLFTLLTVLVPGPNIASAGVIITSFVLVRFFVGAAHAPIFPILNTAISRWFPRGSWALPLGFSSMALTLGYAAGAAILSFLIVAFGWRVSFLIFSPLGLVVAAIWWWYARDYPAEHRSTNQAELDLIGVAETEAKIEEQAPSWVEVIKNRNVILLTISYSCMNFVFYEVFNWFHYYLVSVRGFEATVAGFVSSSQWIAGAVGAVLGGWICDKLCRRIGLRWGCRWPIIVGMLMSAALLVAGAFLDNAMLAAGMLALCFFFNQMTESTYWATSIAIGNQYAGTAGGIMNTGANIMGILNAILVPLFAKHVGWELALSSGAVFAVIGAILLLFVRADEPAV